MSILLNDGVDDVAVAEEAARRGISVVPLSSCRLRAEGRSGLLLGYGGVDVQGIQNGVRKLSLCVERVGDSVPRSLLQRQQYAGFDSVRRLGLCGHANDDLPSVITLQELKERIQGARHIRAAASGDKNRRTLRGSGQGEGVR